MTTPARMRSTLTLSAYRHAAGVTAIAAATGTTTPPAAVVLSSTTGDAVVEAWSGRSLQVPTWSAPAGTTTRVRAGGLKGQNVTSAIVVDRPGGGQATADRTSVDTTLTAAIAWSLVLGHG